MIIMIFLARIAKEKTRRDEGNTDAAQDYVHGKVTLPDKNLLSLSITKKCI